jgi:hypothetical protein
MNLMHGFALRGALAQEVKIAPLTPMQFKP